MIAARAACMGFRAVGFLRVGPNKLLATSASRAAAVAIILSPTMLAIAEWLFQRAGWCATTEPHIPYTGAQPR